MELGQATPEVTTAELRQILADRSAFVFDARPYLAYAISHIPGSLTAAARAGMVLSPAGGDVATIERIVPDKTAPLVLYGNGPFCDQCRRLTEELLVAGFRNVRRYQLGIPVWRALVGLTQIELEGICYVLKGDRTALWVDSRSPAESTDGALSNAIRPIDGAGIAKSKGFQGLPIQDHNTRIVVFGKDGEQAYTVAATIARQAFQNVSYFNGTFAELRHGLQRHGLQ